MGRRQPEACTWARGTWASREAAADAEGEPMGLEGAAEAEAAELRLKEGSFRSPCPPLR